MAREPVYSEGQKRHFRLMSIVNTEGRIIALDYLKKLIAFTTLDQHLIQPNIKVIIDGCLKQGLIKQNQYNVLYPNPGTIDENDLDVTLLAFLIRQLHPSVKATNKVWKSPPRGNLSTEADISRLTQKRNFLSHSGRADLSEAEFLAEFQELEMILGRLVKFTYGSGKKAQDLLQRIQDKKDAQFEEKPSLADAATSVSSSLDGPPFPSPECCSVSSLSSVSTETIPNHNEVGTSTTSLQLNRKLSSRVKRFIEPFMPAATRNTHSNLLALPKHQKAGEKHRDRNKCKSCFCGVGRSLRVAGYLNTPDHSYKNLRCKITGLVILAKGCVVAADNTHDVIQVFPSRGNLPDEIECCQPYGVCILGPTTFAVSTQKPAKVIVFEINNNTLKTLVMSESEIQCNTRLSDIKCNNGYLYVLCENNDIHLLDQTTLQDKGSMPTNIPFVSHMDISPDGNKFFLSHDDCISCLDTFGNVIWKYSYNSHSNFAGICVSEKRLFVAHWTGNALLELKLTGEHVKEFGRNVQYPWSVFVRGKTVLTSQYMSTLDATVCREILKVTL